MKEKFSKAIDKISKHLLEINDEEFDKIIDEHKNGDYANILHEMSYSLSQFMGIP